MQNSQTGGKTWGAPFQRSTVVLYWNKELFKEAGLDPEKAPANWAEQVAFAQKLTKTDGSGATTQWGIQVPSTGFPYWLFQGFSTQAGAILMNQDGNRTLLRQAGGGRGADLLGGPLAQAQGAPDGHRRVGDHAARFLRAKIAMMWTTTGNLTNVRNNAKFPFGVAMLPAGKRRGSPTGGGNFYISKKAPQAQQEAAYKFVRWVTHARARRAVVRRHRLRRGTQGRVRHARAEEVRRGVSGGGGGARPARVCRGRALHAREPARDQGAERRPAGRAHRHQAAGAGHEGLRRRKPSASSRAIADPPIVPSSPLGGEGARANPACTA